MAISIANAVKKHLLPIMEAKGYKYIGASLGTWGFLKMGKKEQRVFIQRGLNSTLQLEFLLLPTFLYRDLSIALPVLEKYPMYDKVSRSWPFRTQADVNQIIQNYAQIMEELGFEMMECADCDSHDLVPTTQMHERLYYEHAHLAEQFLEQKELVQWDRNNFAHILSQAMLDYKEQFRTEPSEDVLLQFAAAYGIVFEQLGAEWTLNNQVCLLDNQRKSSTGLHIINPLATVFNFLHFQNSEGAEKRLEMYLPN